MSEWSLRLQENSRYQQWVLITGLCIVVLLINYWGWLRPWWDHREKLTEQYKKFQQQYQTKLSQWHEQTPLQAQLLKNRQLAASLQTTEVKPFSLITSIAQNAHIEKWQPGDQGDELILLSGWPQFQQILHSISTLHPPVFVQKLLLERNGEHLRLTLHFGVSDEH